jgi:ERCC4-type nuclease
MLIAPTEPLPLRRCGQVSGYPERLGVDVFWVSQGSKCGVQRKEMSDFVASIIDGRLHKEVLQMAQLTLKALVLEGRPKWTEDGVWMGPVRWDRFRHRQSLFTLQFQGIWVIQTDALPETIEAVKELERWSRKPKHQFAAARAKATGQWGTPTSREFGLHVLMSFPGVGPELAERIWSHYGRIPLQWQTTEAELLSIEGIGKKRARQMLEAFSVTPDPSDAVMAEVALAGTEPPCTNGEHPE